MNLTTRARRLQARTGWPYQTCLQKIRDLGAKPSELAQIHSCSIDQADAVLLDAGAVVLGSANPWELEPDEEIVIKCAQIPANSSANIQIISEKGPFRIVNILVPEHISRDCVFTDIKVGKNSQLISSGAVHAFFFDEKLPPQDLACDIMMRGMVATLSVTNLRDDRSLEFQATLKGKLVSDSHGNFHHSRSPTRRTMLGLGVVPVEPHGTTKITLQTQVSFNPDSLFVHPNVLDGLQVTSLRVIGMEMNVSMEQLREGVATFKAPTMQIADWLCIEVANETDIRKTVCGAIGGTMML
jgi:hypothetical protein